MRNVRSNSAERRDRQRFERLVRKAIDSLPPGVHLSAGRIVLEGFSTPDEARQKLLALIMAMGNDPEGFDARIVLPPG